jgi:hypothetical protein
MPLFLTQAELKNLTIEQKVAAIRKYNLELDLPDENPALTLYNGAIHQDSKINHQIFAFCKPDYTHPLSAYPQDEQYAHLTRYAANLARLNVPQACFVGVPGKTPGLLAVGLTSHEISAQGFWIEVHRTIFLHREVPLVSLDIIAESTVLAPADPDNSLVPPHGIFYDLPLDIRDQS